MFPCLLMNLETSIQSKAGSERIRVENRVGAMFIRIGYIMKLFKNGLCDSL